MCPFSSHCKFFMFFRQSDNPQVKATIRDFCRTQGAWQGCVRALLIQQHGKTNLAVDIGPQGRQV